MLPLRLFRRRNFSFANLETFTVYAGALDAELLPDPLPPAAGRLLAFRSGAATVPVTVVMFFLSPRVGRLSMRLGPRLFMGIGPLVCAARCSGCASSTPGFDYWTQLLPPLLLFSVGLR